MTSGLLRNTRTPAPNSRISVLSKRALRIAAPVQATGGSGPTASGQPQIQTESSGKTGFSSRARGYPQGAPYYFETRGVISASRILV